MPTNFFKSFLNKTVHYKDFRSVGVYKRFNFFQPVLVVMTTTRCNFHCPHCLREFIDDSKRLTQDLSVDIFERVLGESQKINLNHVSFSGGEPILHPEFGELISLVDKYDQRFNFATNGWLYEEYWKIIKQNRERLNIVLLSIDGATAEVHDAVRNKPGSFERAVSAIKFYRKNKVPLAVTFCITKQNYHQIEEIVLFCVEYGVSLIRWVAVLDLKENFKYALTADEKFQALERIRRMKEIFGRKLDFGITINLAAASIPFGENGEYSIYCPLWQGMQSFLDHDGALLFCCDLYEVFPNKPLVQNLGFKKCLEINFDMVNEIKKRYLRQLIAGSPDAVFGRCSFCNRCAKEFLAGLAASKNQIT